MTSERLTVRRAVKADDPFLERMFVEAALWRPEWAKVELRVLLDLPELAAYFAGWGRRGDVALIARYGDVAVGAGWFRLFTADAPGYGFVDAETPEIGVAVVSSFRRRGAGGALVRQLQIAAEEHHYPGLSLSVHPENPARHLYASMGFAATEISERAMTMLWRR